MVVLRSYFENRRRKPLSLQKLSIRKERGYSRGQCHNAVGGSAAWPVVSGSQKVGVPGQRETLGQVRDMDPSRGTASLPIRADEGYRGKPFTRFQLVH